MNHSRKLDKQLSKSLTWILRHGAKSAGLIIHDGGYIDVQAILTLKNFKAKNWNEEDIIRVASMDNKMRFSLRKSDDHNGVLQIRANQGHTMPEISDDGLLKTISNISDMPDQVIHGTYFDKWELIKQKGLSRMKRNHIHFATGLPGDDGVISGMRSNVDLYIIVDTALAMQDGYTFLRSENNVILCKGNEFGFLPTKYFKEVWKVNPREKMSF